MENTERQQKRQYEWLEKFQWKKGQSGNPNGGPKGKRLKTRVAEMFMSMTDEEMKAFLAEINPETVWKMGEGNPKQDTDITTNGESINKVLVEFINGKEDNNSDTAGISTPIPE